jgi:trigger factor
MDRAVEEGDLVNIDYVGSVNGFELENLSTEGMGTEVIAGSTDYIDDFLTQIIGHKPGDTFDISVTYPEEFGKEELNGKNAVFVTTVNSIIVESAAELNDDFVIKNLSEIYGWTTVDEMRENVTKGLLNKSIHDVVFEFLTTKVSVKSIPKKLVDYQVQSMFVYYQSNAESSGMTLEEYTRNTPSELAYNNLPDINAKAVYCLVTQAIAEDLGMSVSEDDLKTYAAENIGSDGYAAMLAQYGLPFVKQTVLCQKVAEYIVYNAGQAEQT